MTELTQTMQDAAVPVAESGASSVTPEAAKGPKPAGRWAVRINYDPDDGSRQRDFEVPNEQYLKRYQARETIKPENAEPVAPEFYGVVMDPVYTGRRFLRWKPLALKTFAEARDYFANGNGRRKRFIEQFGIDSFGINDPDFTTPGLSPTRLIDAGEFVPLIAGPFYKQLYIYDYLLMHARAFQLVNHNALAAAAVKIMTRFTLGRGLSFHIKDDESRKVWQEFWERNKLRDKSRVLAWDLAWQGELLIRYYERPGPRGFLSVRPLDASTCWEVVTDPEDVDEVYYYHFQWPCLRGDVRIACLDGTNPTLAELAGRDISKKAPLWVYSYDAKRRRVVPGKAVKCWRAGRKRCVEVELDNGEKIVASHDHPFLLRDGRYVWAERLTPRDSLMPLYRRQGYEEVWQPDGRWEPTHHVVAEYAQGRKRRRGEVVHHLNENRASNTPDNLAFVPKRVHDAETSARRWANPDLAIQREHWVETMRRAMTTHWKQGTYRHLTGAGARRRFTGWRKNIAAGVAASWADADKRERRFAAMRQSWAPGSRRNARIATAASTRARNGQVAPKNHKIVAVRPAGTHVVYDLQVECHHNFALAAGVFTHNTPYQIWVTGNIPVSKYIVQQVPPTNVQHLKLNVSAQERRGRSDLLPAMPWFKRFGDFYSGQTVKALLEANLVWKVKIKGDQADVDAFLSNPAFTELPPPGGMWIENESVDLTAQSATMTANRGSMGIGQQLASVIATSLNLPNEYFNIEAGAPSRATALVRTDPAVKAIEDRQQRLKEVLEEMYDRVQTAALQAGRIGRRAARTEPEVGPGEEDAPETLLPPGAGARTRARLVRLR